MPYVRAVPHVKRIADFGQVYHRRIALGDGFDDALLTGDGGLVAECGIANIAFVDGTSIVWPDAPVLEGITMQLLEARLAAAGLPTRRRTVRLGDLGSFTGAFVTNARGIASVGRIDDVMLPVDAGVMDAVWQVYEDVPWDQI